VPLVEIEAQAEHARSLFPTRDEVAAIRVVEIEPPHDGEAVGVFVHRFNGQFVRVGIPQDRVDQRPVDTGLIHGGDRLLGGVRLLTMLRGGRALFPQVNLAIGDQHRAHPFDPKIFSRPRIRCSSESADSAQSGFRQSRLRRPAADGCEPHGGRTGQVRR